MPVQLLDAAYYGNNPSEAEYYTGFSAVSALVPDVYHVAINGRGYMVDLNQPFYRQYRRQLAQLIRTQADTSTLPGDQSMDPNSLWRRSFEDQSLGSGQRYLDRPTVNGSPATLGSVPNAFWYSKGIDVLTTKWQMSLLPATQQLLSTSNTNLATVVVGTNIYVIDGQHLKYATTLGGSFTTVTGTPAVTASSICTDGYDVWVAYGASGVYTTTSGSGSATQYVTSAVDAAAVVSYCNGRLMLASTNNIYNIVASGSLPSPLFTTTNPNVVFTNFAEGLGAIYVGAVVGSQSWIYGMTVTTDGTALGAPVIQGALPPGETIVSLYGSPLGFLMVGSSLGVRMCQEATNGSVTLGSLVPTPQPVQCMTGWNRWVYFGWSKFDSFSSGLGRLDLQNQVVDNVLPAVCSDLMVTTQDLVTSVAVYNGTPILGVKLLGLYGPDPANLVPSGTFQSGYIMYDLTDAKVAALLDVQNVGPHFYGSYSAWISTDAGSFTPVGTAPTNVSPPPLTNTFSVGPVTGQRFEVQLVLNRDAVTTTQGPVITRWTLRSWPAPRRSLTWQLPLIINENVENKSFGVAGSDPLAILQELEGYATTGAIVTFQEGYVSFPVFVQDIQYLPSYTMENRQDNYFNGIALVTLVGLPPATAS